MLRSLSRIPLRQMLRPALSTPRLAFSTTLRVDIGPSRPAFFASAVEQVVINGFAAPLAPPPSRKAVTDGEARVLVQLGADLKSVTSEFTCGGNVVLEGGAAVKLFVEDGAGARRITLPLAGEDALALEKIASPSSFGNGDETVLDPAYRLAFELKPGQFASTFDPLHPSHSILKAISDLTTAGPLTADLHKLNVYPTGGFFKSHRDTPRAPNHIGTLLVGLPTAHTGGELVVRHSGASRSFSFESPTETLPWTFLYSDCEHEILPVTSGTRLTLAYDVFSTASSHPAPPLPLSTSFTPLHKSLSASLQSPDFLPDGGRLAIALSHAYPVERLANGSANPDNGQYSKDLPGRLKGSDALIHSTSAELGLPISFRAVYASKAFSEPYVENEADWWDRTANYESEDHRYEAMREAMHQLGAWDTELVPDEHVPADAFASRSETRDGEHQNDYLLTGKSFLGGGNAGGDDRSEWEIIAHDAGAQVEGDLLWVRKPEKDVWTLASTYQAMGNEGLDRGTYGSVAAVLEVPRWGEGARRVKIAK